MSESASGEASSDSSCNDKELTECPTCGRTDFASPEGIKRHHAMAHGESIAHTKITCKVCGESKKIPDAWVRKGGGDYCSPECHDTDQREQEARTCAAPDCNETFVATKNSGRKFHTYECSMGNRNVDGRHTKECAICGQQFPTGGESKAERRKTCSKECGAVYKSRNYTGENSPTWKGGMPDYYGERWARQRKKARERDDNECVICGKGKGELPIAPDVHHIIPVTDFDDPNDAHDLINLVTLCRKHHSNWEGLYLRPDTRGQE